MNQMQTQSPPQVVSGPLGQYQPKGLHELTVLSEKMADARDMVPKNMVGRPNAILAAFLYGHQIGLGPMQSLNAIAVINGKPCIYGDALKAVVISSPLCVKFEESFLYDTNDPNDVTKWAAKCLVQRKGSRPREEIFTYQDAVRGKLWGKSGPWSDYPKRMLMFRARGFACRDEFPDVLQGVGSAEEQMDIIDLKKGQDFKENEPVETVQEVQNEVPPPPVKKIRDHEEFADLEWAIKDNNLIDFLTRECKGRSYADLPIEKYENIKKWVLERIEELDVQAAQDARNEP